MKKFPNIPEYLTNKGIILKYRIIDEKTGCWLWTRTLDKDGYGIFKKDGKIYKIHRVSYEEFKGPLKNHCLHILECPNKNCTNPEHLYDGTHKQNMRDVIKNGNNYQMNKTHCPKGHEYNEENTYINPSAGDRQCVICRREAVRRSQEKYRIKRKKLIRGSNELAK